MRKLSNIIIFTVIAFFIFSCNQPKNTFKKGEYGYAKSFLKDQNIQFIELTGSDSLAKLILVPDYQGRVMTSTASGDKGQSFGWINYPFIESGKKDPHFNAFGGEERFWIGPEGGPFSIYFEEGKEQVFENWKVPPIIDTEPFEITRQSKEQAAFSTTAKLSNSSGTEFSLKIERTVSLLSRETASSLLGVRIPVGSNFVAYKSVNKIINTGENQWTRESGLLSIWMLGMFNPSPSTVIFIPYNENAEGTIVNDDYFGKVPEERLIKKDGMIYFQADGKHRSKIGLPPTRDKGLAGSYDAENKTLTLLSYQKSDSSAVYVNSKWGKQDDPYNGDAINSYNDGPLEDGSIMGPFYELETSSPGADLKPGESISHSQLVIHITGEKDELQNIISSLADINLTQLSEIFN